MSTVLPLVGRGFHLLGVGADKRPLGEWAQYVGRAASPADVLAWADDRRHAGYAVLCGTGMAVVVLDVEAAGVADPRLRALLDRLPRSCRVPTPSGGEHGWLTVTDGDAPAGRRLAHKVDGVDEHGRPRTALLAETRGAGQYAVLIGPGRDVPSDWAPHPVTRTQLHALLEQVAACSDVTPAPPARPRRSRSTPSSSSTTAEVLRGLLLDGLVDWGHLLDPGWTRLGYDRDGRSLWLRPPYGQPASSATSANGAEGMAEPAPTLVVWSSAVPWAEPGTAYTATDVLARCWFDGDVGAALRAVDELAHGVAAPPFASWPKPALDVVVERLGQRDDGQRDDRQRDDAHAARRLVLTPASKIAPLPVRWLWEDRVPLGALSLLAGREGIGKSLLTVWMAAQATRGELPGSYHGQPRAVLVAATEDDWARTVVPRLIAADADLDRVYRVEVVSADALLTGLALPRDLAALEAAAAEVGAAMILLDPLLSRLDAQLDSHKDAEVRLALEPLVALAGRCGASVVGLIHLNKSGTAEVLDRVMASKAFTAVARSVSVVVVDPDDDGGSRRLFGTPKNNLGRSDLPTLAYAVEGVEVPTVEGPARVGRLLWQGESTVSVADAMSGTPDDRSATAEAADWLRDYVESRGGEAASADIKKAGAAAAHTIDALKRARRRVGLEVVSVGYPRTTVWRVPAPVGAQSEHSRLGDTPTAPTSPTGRQSVQLVQSEQSEHDPPRGAPTGAGVCSWCGHPPADCACLGAAS